MLSHLKYESSNLHLKFAIIWKFFADKMGKMNKMKMKNNKIMAKMKWLKRDNGNGGMGNQGNKRKFALANALSGEVFKRPKLVASQNAVSVLKKTQNATESPTQREAPAIVEEPPKTAMDPMTRHRHSLPIFAARARLD